MVGDDGVLLQSRLVDRSVEDVPKVQRGLRGGVEGNDKVPDGPDWSASIHF